MYQTAMTFGRVLAEMMRVWLVVLYALSATVMGFAHHHAHANSKPDMSAYMLPDGTVPVICFGMGDGSDKGTPGKLTICDACLAMAGANLPPPCPAILAVDFGPGVVLKPAEQTAALARLIINPTSRGPPQPIALIV
ncbi:MAG: hypothetical protein IOC49_01650 [Methylobacterium sp.]|nr:hypothetical protein [Methylobacterium sp.]